MKVMTLEPSDKNNVSRKKYISYMPNACAYDSEPNPEPHEPPGHYEWFEEHWL